MEETIDLGPMEKVSIDDVAFIALRAEKNSSSYKNLERQLFAQNLLRSIPFVEMPLPR